jgi:hypothetical protein
MNLPTLFVLLLGGLAAAVPAGAAELVLVKDGVGRAPIVLSDDAPPLTRRAAGELAAYLEKISGAKPAVIEGLPQPIPRHAIWVGYQPVLEKLFPKIDFAFSHPEEILVAANKDHLVIAGRDRWDPDHLVAEVRDERIVGKQQEYGTVNAVYTFLHDQLGVRWLWPGELGEDFVEKETIALAPFEYRYHPQIRARGGVFHFSALGNRGYGRSHQWTRRQRLQLDSLHQPGGHAFGDWWGRFHQQHRDYFALQPDGTRSGFPSPKNAKLCQSNPAVWAQWLRDVEAQLKRDPTQTVFSGAPNDGWYSGHCVCQKCSAWDHPDGEPRMFHWKGTHREHVALSDRHVTFANQLARRLAARYPERDYHVLMLSYGHSRPVPVEAVPADNVIIASVANFYGRTHLKDRGSSRGTTHREQFAGWGKLAPQLMWRPNTGSPAGWQQGLPDLSVRQTIDDLRFVAEHRCIGIYIDSVWEHWATQGPQYYLMAQLAWDPEQDAEAVLDDYYRRGFGPAAEEVRTYFTLLERARMAFVAEHGYSAGVRMLPELYTEDLLAEAEAHLRRATVRLDGKADRYRRRVAFVRAGLAFTERLVETIALMTQYWEQPAADVAERVKENWQAIEALCQRHPYAVNWGPLRPQTPRMRGLHPDYPNPKWKPSARRPPAKADGFDRD